MTLGNLAFPADLRQRLKSFITERSGLYFKDHDLNGLDNVVRDRMKAHSFDSALSYYNYLTTSEERDEELRELFNLLTVNHTYFFRNEPHFKALKEKVLPEIIQKKIKQAGKEKPSLRIWSAGCSSGEEPYTIAITLQELISDLENWGIQIIATDASSEALGKARKGLYSENSVKTVSKNYLDKYFSVEPGHSHSLRYAVSNRIKDMVNFGYHNLMEEGYPLSFDIIFCRNVVIYFDFGTCLKVMERFHRSLNEGGYLFIGYSETLHFLPDKFKMISWEDAIYYRKAQGVEEAGLALAKPSLPEKNIDQILEEISRKQVLAELEAEAKKIALPPKKIEEFLIEINKAFYLKKYNAALGLIDEALAIDKKAIDVYYIAAEIYVNQANFTLAKDKLSSALKMNPLFAPAHYLFGCINIEEGVLDRAVESFKKALYIDKGFLAAYFYLANAHKLGGRADDAIRGYRNTLKLLSRLSSEEIVPYSGGFEAATLMNICRDNIERLKLGQ